MSARDFGTDVDETPDLELALGYLFISVTPSVVDKGL